MSSAAATPARQPLAPVSAQRRREFRIIPRLEADARVVALAQTIPGKVALLAVFGLALSLADDSWPLKLALVSCTTFLPRARRFLVTVGTLLFADFFWFERGTLAASVGQSAQGFGRLPEFFWIILPLVLLCAVLMWLAARYPKSLIGQRPLVFLIGLCTALVVAARYAPLTGFPRFAVWAFLGTFCSYFWYLAYAMSDCATPHRDNLLYQAGTFHPFWGSTGVPIPKGASHWRKIEAKTPEDLAITMIKGVKLMVWCVLLSLVKTYYLLLIHQKLAIPSPGDCMQAFLSGKPLAWGSNWLSWPADLLLDLLTISIWGHAFIATCRMAGFRALRNTYAPLSSRTIAEYWNRYYFYFKELLVDMFFYPAFIRYFKQRPKVRIFFATFVAASLGNTLYHLIRGLHSAAHLGLLATLGSFRNYFFYSVLLALGIAASQIRNRDTTRSKGWLRERIVAPACVLGFYCFVHVFEISAPVPGLRYLGFLLTGR